MKKWLFIMAILSLGAKAQERVVVLSGDVADVVAALGYSSKVVGRDDTNKNPAFSHAKSVGLHRNLTLEPIIALKPDLVIGSYMVEPKNLYERLKSLKINAHNVAPTPSKAAYEDSIRQIGKLFGKTDKANQIAGKWAKDMGARATTKKRYLLSYDGRIVAGRGTVGDELIRLAGGINAADVDGLKPMAREGWQNARADIIIIAKHQERALKGFALRPEILKNPAAKNGQIYFWPANDFLRYGLDSPQVLDKMHALGVR